MNLSKEDIKHIADLSRLKIEDEKLEMYRGHLVSILGYVEKLTEVDTNGVAEFVSVFSSVNVWRRDEAKPCDLSERDSVIKSFPRRQGALLEVPAVFEGRVE
jgi:aspartyl-tRNA(Asn)/glutamyl-tRNA(Gln) amidotransferase subunit C